MTQDFRKNMKLKWGHVRSRMRGNLTVIIWEDKRNVNTLTNRHHPPAEDNSVMSMGML
jgi:hypothetical protein